MQVHLPRHVEFYEDMGAVADVPLVQTAYPLTYGGRRESFLGVFTGNMICLDGGRVPSHFVFLAKDQRGIPVHYFVKQTATFTPRARAHVRTSEHAESPTYWGSGYGYLSGSEKRDSLKPLAQLDGLATSLAA